jgi:hypothetical protein
VNRFLLALALIAFAVRGLMPSGWMPTGEHGFEITICAGVDTHKVWLDSKGKLHKQDPSKKALPDKEPCAFGALAMASDFSSQTSAKFIAARSATVALQPDHHVSIGRGLAAPPPPARGPPILI